MKGIKILPISLMLAVISFCACGTENGVAKAKPPEHEEVNLVYYTIGTPDSDLHLVNKAVNELLNRELGITITYNKVGWQDYENKLNTLVASGGDFDIAFALDFDTHAWNGSFLALDEYLLNEGFDMYQIVDPILWDGVRLMDGKIYGVPTNKELSVREHWMYPLELIEKYGINISDYTTLESLEPLLRMIKLNEPDYLPMELDKKSNNFFAFYGYEYITDRTLPLVIKYDESELTVKNVFETEEGISIMRTLRSYYLEGYINEDAALKESSALEHGKKVFWRQASGGIFSEITWSRDRGYAVVSQLVTPSIVTTEHTRGGVMSVSSRTDHPVECVKFLNCLNTNAELRNLFNFGIENVHYTLNENNQVVQTLPNSYSGVQYTQGNWFILLTLEGDPLNKWDLFKEENNRAVKSPILGFVPDLSRYKQEVENIRVVFTKYYSSLMTGSVNIDLALPKFIDELNMAGIKEVQSEIQIQLDKWSAQGVVE